MSGSRKNKKANEPLEPEIVNPEHDAAVLRLSRLAWVLDSIFVIPGTNIRFGLDPLMGLIPVFGDLLGAAVSTWILSEAANLGVPRTTLIRMSFNIGIEAVVGVVPFAGDAFDVAWKANVRNVKLLEAYLRNPKRTARASRLFVFGLGLGVFLSVLGVIALGVFLGAQLWHWVSG